MQRSCFYVIGIFILFIVSAPARAGWVLDGKAVSTAPSNQGRPTMASDGAGGAIITWQDDSGAGGTYDVYAQRMDAAGNPQWGSNGIAVCTATNSQSNPAIVSDGAGGAIITWHDYRGGIAADVYTQRVNASGAPQWTANGVALCTATNDQSYPMIVTDGAGGAIVTWQDYRSGTNLDVYAQRVNASGTPQWAANGVLLCNAAAEQSTPTIVSDGAGGGIVTWQDFRGGNYDIYAQRVNTSGTPQWTANGVVVCADANGQFAPRIVSDGSAGAIIIWTDYRNVFGDIYAQRVNAAGATLWTSDGVAVCTAANEQAYPTIISDSAGGAIVTWADLRGGTNYDIYAQRVSALGAPQWASGGIAICTAANDQFIPMIVPDGAGGAIITWEDYRNVVRDIYAQHASGSGALQWVINGVAVSNAASEQSYPAIVSDGAGSAIVAWFDGRSGISWDIYAQRIEGVYGYWGHPEPILVSVADVRNDQGGKVALNWSASGRDLPSPATIDFYSVWRATTVAPLSSSAVGSVVLTSLDQIKPGTKPGTRLALATSSYYFELVGTQSAYRFPAYSFAADTRADSVAGNIGTTYFMVSAHSTSDAHIAFMSNVLSGHSVDNLAPIAPLALTAQRTGNYVHLKWNGVHVRDLKNYTVYRKTSSGVTPVPANFLANDNDTVLTDTTPPASALYYIVTAYDVHGNQGAPSNQAAVGSATNVGDLPPITSLMVLHNHPNPFAASTQLEIGLPEAALLKIEIFDVAGRLVRDVQLGGERGWQQVRLDGVDNSSHPLASGVYFYRIHAAAQTITRKMVIAR